MNSKYKNHLLNVNKSNDLKRIRVMVQIGQCSDSVGAKEILHAIKPLTSSIDLIETGCDGLCFLAPKVIIEYPNKAVSIFNNVSENDKTEIVNQIQNPTTENNRQSALQYL